MKQHVTWLPMAFAALLLLPDPSHSHNGVMVIAVPVEGITVDGDLSDWPEGMRVYPIELAERGVAPRDSTDFRASFRIGFSEQENALYVAVQVRDESVVVNAIRPNTFWMDSDGCEVYVDVGHGRSDTTVVQHGAWGD
jgi:cellulose/xylan binding protein with CBM9 domain